MLEAIPKGWFSWDFTIRQEDRIVADIDISVWREKALLVVEGKPYKVYREGLVSGAFILESDGSVLAKAWKPSAFRRSFNIEYGDEQFTFSAKSPLGRGFVLLDASGEIGSLSPGGILTRRANVDLPERLPLPVRIFMIWLALILWRRNAESSSAGGTA